MSGGAGRAIGTSWRACAADRWGCGWCGDRCHESWLAAALVRWGANPNPTPTPNPNQVRRSLLVPSSDPSEMGC